MAFVLPTFNLTCDIGNVAFPLGGPARIVNEPCQLRGPNPNNAINATAGTAGFIAIVLLLGPLVDIRDPFNLPINNGDYVEVPSGTGRYYRVAIVDDIGKGFPNEHRFAVLIKVQGFPWPTPSP